jgi:hypothetical protein
MSAMWSSQSSSIAAPWHLFNRWGAGGNNSLSACVKSQQIAAQARCINIQHCTEPLDLLVD